MLILVAQYYVNSWKTHTRVHSFTSKGASTEERLKDIKRVVATSTAAHSLLEGILSILIVDFTLLRVA